MLTQNKGITDLASNPNPKIVQRTCRVCKKLFEPHLVGQQECSTSCVNNNGWRDYLPPAVQDLKHRIEDKLEEKDDRYEELEQRIIHLEILVRLMLSDSSDTIE